jgi:hypothetical protein
MFANRSTGRVAAALLSAGLAWICSPNPVQGAPAPAPAGALRLGAATLWVVAPDEPEALQCALRDVENAWYKVFGRLPSVVAGMWNRGNVLVGLYGQWQDAPQRAPKGAKSWLRGTRVDIGLILSNDEVH